MDWLWTVVAFFLSWVWWIVWKFTESLFWSIFGLPFWILVFVTIYLLWRVGPRETLRRLKEMRYAVIAALRAFAIALITIVSAVIGVSILEKLPERARRVLLGGAAPAQARAEERVVEREKIVERTVYQCGPIMRLFNVFLIFYGLMQAMIAFTILAMMHALYTWIFP